MGKLLAVVRREYLERVRSRWFLIATLFGPVFFGALMVLPAVMASRDKGSADANNIIVLDATGAGLGERVAARLAGGLGGGASPQVEVVPDAGALVAAESLATQAVVAERSRGYLVLDEATMAGRSARYAGSNTTAIFDMQRLERAVQREVLAQRLASSGVDPEVGQSLLATSVNVTTERLSKRGRGGSGQLNIFVGLAVAMLLYITIFIYGLNVLRGVLEEKQTRVAEVVIASISPSRLLAGKVIGIGGVGLTQVTIWMAASMAMWQVRQPILARFGAGGAPVNLPDVTIVTGLVLLAFFVLGFLLYAGLFAAVGATVNSEQEAQQAQMPVVLLLVSSIIFAQNILMSPDGALSRVLSTLPFSAPIVMPLRMTVTTVPTGDLLLALGSVAAGAAAATWLASRVYRVGLLMYGKRPSVGEVLRWIRRG